MPYSYRFASVGRRRGGHPRQTRPERHEQRDACVFPDAKRVLSKTLAERAAWDFMDREARQFRLVTILPTMVFGPSRTPGKESTGSLGFLRDWFVKGREGCCPWYPDGWPHGHFSMVDVRDVCAQQIACLEQAGATGRYLSLAECGGWTELDKLMNELYPAMPLSAPVSEPVESRFGEPIADPIVTRFDLSRMQSLRASSSVRQILQEGLSSSCARRAPVGAAARRQV